MTCPVHVLGAYMAALPKGHQPFAHIPAGSARAGLRRMLQNAEVPDAHLYWLHDLRRGHADDLRAAGASTEVVRAAGSH